MNFPIYRKTVSILLVISFFIPALNSKAGFAAGTESGRPDTVKRSHGSAVEKDNAPFIYEGQHVYFVKAPGVDLYSDTSKTAVIKRRLEPDALLVKISLRGGWAKVFVPAYSCKGYIQADAMTDSVLTRQELEKRTADATADARNFVLEQFHQSPSIDLMEKAAGFSFVSKSDMLSLVSVYQGDISRLPFKQADSLWALPVKDLPRVAARACGPDTAGPSLFSDTSRVVLIGGAPYLNTSYCYSLSDSLRKRIFDSNAVYLESNYFYEGLRLIRLVRSMTKDPVMVTHDPPFFDREIEVNFAGVGRFVHTFPNRFPVTLLTKNGFVAGTLVAISHSKHVCPCHGVGDNFIIKSPLPSESKILGILIGFQRPADAKPRIRLKANGGWTADLDGDGKPDLKCVVKGENNDDHLIHSTNEISVGCYYYVKRGGIWYLTDVRLEPMCT